MKSHAIFRQLRPCILVIAALIPIETLATIKCWTNREGVRECGDVIPPEYAQQEHEEKSASGIVTRKHERSKTPEEVAAERARREEAARRQAAAAADARRQADSDRVLLHTFSSEEDLLLARDGQLANVESQVKVTESHLEKLDKSLDQMIGEAADFERRGRKVPSRLTRNIGEVRGQIEEQKAFIAEKRAEQAQISAKFERDLARFRELRASPPGR